MPKPYSVDLRARVIEDVQTGASRREAADDYGISPSVVIIWVQRFKETGSVSSRSIVNGRIMAFAIRANFARLESGGFPTLYQ